MTGSHPPPPATNLRATAARVIEQLKKEVLT
jgi:hypothetical protein